jgi:hypothetical protein
VKGRAIVPHGPNLSREAASQSVFAKSFYFTTEDTESTEGIADWSNNLPMLSADFNLQQNLIFSFRFLRG